MKIFLRPFSTLFCMLLVCVFVSPSQAKTREAKKLALVIGNSAYENASPLPNPRNDAEEVSRILEDIGFNVIKVIDASKKQQKNVVKVFLETLRQYDIGLFFYAGHAISINGQNYLIPVDAKLTKKEDVERELQRVDGILGVSMKNKQMLVFLDACRNNPFVEKAASISDMQVGRGLSQSQRIESQKGGGLSRLETGTQDLFVAFATDPGNVALDGSGKHSPFTKGLIEHLSEPMEVREMMTKVRASVAKETNFEQIPWEQNSLLKPVYLSGRPELGKMEIYHIANVTKVNRGWGYVVADIVGDRVPKVGEMVQIDIGGDTIEAKVGKVMANSISIMPASWDQEITSGARVVQEEFSGK